MSYDNRANRVNGFIRRAFSDYPLTTWSAIVFVVAMVVLTIIFPFPMWIIWATLGGMGLFAALIVGILNEFY